MKQSAYIILLVASLLCLTRCDWFDYDLPLVSITYPIDGAYLTEPVTIRAEVTDTDSVEFVVFLVDDIEIGKDSLPPYEMYWEVAYWSDGHNHSITACATDEAGNIGLSNMVTVRVSTSARIGPPDIIAPAKEAIFAIDSPITFKWRSVRIAVQYELEISSTNYFADIIYDTSVTDTATTLSDLEEGSYYWRIRGVDSVGYRSSWSEIRRLYLAADPSDVLVFTEYESNPVISGGDYYWNSRQVVWPSVIHDNGLYKIWFCGLGGDGQNSIGYATSMDGIDWDIRAEPVLEPIFTEDAVQHSLREPFVMKVEAGYRMYYTAKGSAGVFQIYMATSTDGITWERYSSEPVLRVGELGEFDSGFIITPRIIYRNGTYSMWYNASNGQPKNADPNASVGLATSPDGISWTKYGSNPVLQSDPVADKGLIAIGSNCISILPDGSFEMFYHGHDGLRRFVCRAWSSDGINWSRDPFNPIINPGDSGTWNDCSSSSASVLLQGDDYHIWFCGDTGYTWSIGYGTAQSAE